MTSAPAAFSQAREEFLALVADVRPELHRYCARLTGSVIEGEDIVQETLAKALYALSQTAELPALRPWLFRVAHNTALDFLKRHATTHHDADTDVETLVAFEEAPDPLVVRAALARFLTLPVLQRSAVILKDVLGHSLEETAETMGTSVMAVKAALSRGRAQLLAASDAHARSERATRAELERYAALFNARDWDGVRALVGDDCELDLVSKSQRRGKQVGVYFTHYATQAVTLRVVRLEGELAFAAYVGEASTPSYFVLLAFEAGRVRAIRDFRYVPYIAAEAEFELVGA